MQEKQRHGFLTFWLVLMAIANIASTYLNAVAVPSGAMPRLPNVGDGIYYMLAAASFFNFICTIALFRWKKWGFYGFIASSVLALIVNIFVAKLGILASLPGVLGVVLLYGVLQIGSDNKGWPQLD